MVRVASAVVILLLAFSAFDVKAGNAQVEDLKTQVEALRREINKKDSDKTSAPIGRVDDHFSNKFGCDTPVTTKSGKLVIGGLVQVWFQHVSNDQRGVSGAFENNAISFPSVEGGVLQPGGLIGANSGTIVGESFLHRTDSPGEVNSYYDNDTFRIRRTELRFTMDIHENITAHVMVDPSRTSNIRFLPLPTFPIHNQPFDELIRQGIPYQAQLLQDAYINVHGIIPHHDVTVGQFKPPSGEEAWRNSGQLEFVERAMVNGISNVRDQGIMAHGTWFDGRLQYWAGVFNGPDNSVLVDPEIFEAGNRTDDNDEKDFAWRIMGRPLWNKDKWTGRLELGYARTDGMHGEAHRNGEPEATPNGPQFSNGTNNLNTWINRQSAWFWYRPGSLARGFWLRGEYGSQHDRYSQQIQFTFLLGTAPGGIQAQPKTVDPQGFYLGTGYKMSESPFAKSLKECGGLFGKTIHDMEFVGRYEQYENIGAENPATPDRDTDLFRTKAYTLGMNYFIRGHDLKVQANYIWVDDPNDGRGNSRGFREVKNDVFVINFQAMF